MLYRVDAFELIWSNDHTLLDALLSRLPYEPNSMFRAEQQDAPRLFGYSDISKRLDDLHDLLALFHHLFMQANSEKGASLPDPWWADRPLSPSGGKGQTSGEDPEREVERLMNFL